MTMFRTHDPRGIAVVAKVCGSTYKHACDRALALLALYYGSEAGVRLYSLTSHTTPSSDSLDAGTERGSFIVHALGLHRDGEHLKCDPSSSGYLSLPYDMPCVHNQCARDIPSGAPPSSTLGQNRGALVAIQDGVAWRSVQVPERDWFQVNPAGEVYGHFRLPGYDPKKPPLVLP